MTSIDQIQGVIRLKNGQKREFLLSLPDATQEQWTSALRGVCSAVEAPAEDGGKDHG